MIRTIRLDINAAYPQLPLEPVNVFAGSAASLTICNVPKAVGDRAISAVSASVKLKGGTTESFSAVRVGSAWEVTIPATKFADPYSATLGVRIIATGTDENKTAATWTLAVADLYVLNNVGSVTPGADAGDVKHSEFAALDADTSTLADVISILKGSAMALTLALTSLFTLPTFAALSVVPVYTNHNRVAGNVQTMTNLQQWAAAVETAIGQGGGVDTNAVREIAASASVTNAGAVAAATNAAAVAASARYLSMDSSNMVLGGDVFWYDLAGSVMLRTLKPISVNGDIYSGGSMYIPAGGSLYSFGSLDEHYSWGMGSYVDNDGPAGVSFKCWFKGANPSTLTVDGSPVATSNMVNGIVSASVDFTTNNAALVSTVTNLAPSKARGISLADPVRHCNWYQSVTNGVFFWAVED